MNNVYVMATAQQNGSIRVYANRHYCHPAPIAIDIGLDANTRENLIIAELLALRFVLCELSLAGENRQHGIGLAIHCSHGAIRKLVRHSSALAHLAPYAQFLATRFVGAQIQIAHRRPDWAYDDQVVAFHTISTTAEMATIPSVIGTLLPTHHAMTRMVERHICHSPDTAFQVMHRHLNSPTTTKMGWSAEASIRCRKKYGKTSSLLYHAASRTMYVVADDKRFTCPVVVTAYTVEQQYMAWNGIQHAAA